MDKDPFRAKICHLYSRWKKNHVRTRSFFTFISFMGGENESILVHTTEPMTIYNINLRIFYFRIFEIVQSLTRESILKYLKELHWLKIRYQAESVDILKKRKKV